MTERRCQRQHNRTQGLHAVVHVHTAAAAHTQQHTQSDRFPVPAIEPMGPKHASSSSWRRSKNTSSSPHMSKGFSRSCCVLNSSMVMRQYTVLEA